MRKASQAFFVCPAWALTWWWKSTTSTARNESSKSLAKSKGVVVRQGLKEAGGKIAGLRIETAYEACMMDESAK